MPKSKYQNPCDVTVSSTVKCEPGVRESPFAGEKTKTMAKCLRFATAHLKTAATNYMASSSLSQFSYCASYHTIQAIPREFTGCRVAERERAQGRIPAVVFSQNLLEKDPNSRSSSRKLLLTTERKQIKSILKSVESLYFCSTRFRLHIRAGSGSSHLLESGTVLPIKIHRDEETGKILNLVFVWADEGTDLKVDVPIVFKGEDVCPGLKKGGHFNKIRTSLKYLCPAEQIPSKVVVDVSKLDIGDRIFVRDVEVHSSLKLLSKNENMPICKITATSWENQESAVH